ncbi:uncharacterized protein CXorf49 homolog [Phyllostomus hastatus]|uniref:uncharacterized protein CXorf49 homolog n=1 Tax=Phyllostomus hastatus TaxID=9423 RepID=UPI001E683828|nr:uncharacterized protein CXorf49 homolog [Phyllostomus hastatus]
MSSLNEDEGSVSREGLDPESGQRAGAVGFALELPQNREGEVEHQGQGEGEGQFPDPEGFMGDQHVMEVAGQVAQGWEGRSGSPADSEGATWALFGNTVAMPLPQRLPTRAGWGSRRSLFPESRDRDVSTVWLEPEPGPRGRGTRAHGWLGSQISPGVSFHFRGPEGDCVRGSPKQGVRYRSKASVDRQRAFEEGLESLPWSESELSGQFSEMQLTGGSIRQKGGGWAKLESLSDTRSPWSSSAREKFLPLPGPCLSFVPQTLSSGEAGQAVRDPEVSSEEPLSVPWGEAGSGPSYLPLVAAAGELPKATPRGNVAQEVTALERATKVVLEGFFHMPGQRGSGAPQDPATSSWIGGVPLFGTDNSHALAPIGTKESKPTGAGQESVAQRNSGSEPVVGEGDAEEPGREPFPESEVLPSLPLQGGLGFLCTPTVLSSGHAGPGPPVPEILKWNLAPSCKKSSWYRCTP